MSWCELYVFWKNWTECNEDLNIPKVKQHSRNFIWNQWLKHFAQWKTLMFPLKLVNARCQSYLRKNIVGVYNSIAGGMDQSLPHRLSCLSGFAFQLLIWRPHWFFKAHSGVRQWNMCKLVTVDVDNENILRNRCNDDKEWGYIDNNNIHNPTNIPTEWVDLEGTF